MVFLFFSIDSLIPPSDTTIWIFFFFSLRFLYCCDDYHVFTYSLIYLSFLRAWRAWRRVFFFFPFPLRQTRWCFTIASISSLPYFPSMDNYFVIFISLRMVSKSHTPYPGQRWHLFLLTYIHSLFFFYIHYISHTLISQPLQNTIIDGRFMFPIAPFHKALILIGLKPSRHFLLHGRVVSFAWDEGSGYIFHSRYFSLLLLFFSLEGQTCSAYKQQQSLRNRASWPSRLISPCCQSVMRALFGLHVLPSFYFYLFWQLLLYPNFEIFKLEEGSHEPPRAFNFLVHSCLPPSPYHTKILRRNLYCVYMGREKSYVYAVMHACMY